MRVHDLVPKPAWAQRREQVNAFEQMLTDSGTHILKGHVHTDSEEQFERFRTRNDNPVRHWQIGDGAEQPRWEAYTAAFADVPGKTGITHAFWFIIPSSHKWFRKLALSRIITETLESLSMRFPEPTDAIDDIRQSCRAIEQEATIGAELAQLKCKGSRRKAIKK